jgi:hypothetical protein
MAGSAVFFWDWRMNQIRIIRTAARSMRMAVSMKDL